MKYCYLNFILILVVSPVAFAEQQDGTASYVELVKSQEDLSSEYSRSPLSRKDTANTGWELVASKDTKKVDLKWSPFKNDYNLSFIVSAPLDEEEDKTSIYRSDTDAFVNSTSITISSSVEFLSSQYDPLDVSKLRRVCVSHPKAFAVSKTDVNEIKQECYSKGTYDLLKAFVDEEVTDPDILKAFYNATDNFLTPFYKAGMSATYGNKAFTYFDPDVPVSEEELADFDPLKTVDNREKPYGVEAFFTYVKPLYFQATVGFEFQRDYQTSSKGKKQTRCTDNGEDLSFHICKDALVGAPMRIFNRNINVSLIIPLRNYLSTSLLDVTISPEFTYNLANDVRSWKVPVYFIGDKDGNLSAGVMYEFESGDDGDEFFGFFLGGKY